MIYRSKKDWWSVLLVATPALVGAVVVLIIGTSIDPVPESARVPLAIAGVVIIAVQAILLWFFSASYEITPEELIVRFGPIRLRYRLSTIVEAIPRRGPLARASVNFATSWDLVYIIFRGREPGLPMTISPVNKAEFLRELAERVPGLVVRAESGPAQTTRP
jgi:hypothetical protein